MVKKYSTQPKIVEAVQWLGTNFDELEAFAGDNVLIEDGILKCKTGCSPNGITVATHKYGDFVVKDEQGYFYISEYYKFITSHEEVE